MIGDFFNGVVDGVIETGKDFADGVVNTGVNKIADQVIDTGTEFTDSILYGASDGISNVATNLFGEQFGSHVETFTGNIADNISGRISDTIRSSDLLSQIRSFNLFGSNTSTSVFSIGSWNDGAGFDWRVRLTLPTVGAFLSSPVLQPLRETDDSMVWPYTPLVVVSNNANYNNLSPTHNNYTYPAYENSSIENITIAGEFVIENQEDAKYWVAANHFLRAVTKMSYGNSNNAGAPPPVIKLNGYGDFVFNNVPVVVESFMINLPKDVDYIQAQVGPNGSWVPVVSEISVTVKVAYSRDEVNKFSLENFVNGDYLSGSPIGFI